MTLKIFAQSTTSRLKTQEELVVFLRIAEKHCPGGVRVLRTGLELVNKSVKRLKLQLGIQHHRSIVYSPEQTGAAERENRTLMEAAQTMVENLAKNSGLKFSQIRFERVWKYLCGKCYAFEVCFQKKPNIADLKVFGEEVYTHIPTEKPTHKLPFLLSQVTESPTWVLQRNSLTT